MRAQGAHAVALDHGEKIAEGSFEAVRSNPQVIEAYLGRGAAGPAGRCLGFPNDCGNAPRPLPRALRAAHAEAGDFSAAVEAQQRALHFARTRRTPPSPPSCAPCRRGRRSSP